MKEVKFFSYRKNKKKIYFFFLVNTKNISSGVENISNLYFIWCWKYQQFHSCYALVKLLLFQHIRWNIFGIHLKKVNILYFLPIMLQEDEQGTNPLVKVWNFDKVYFLKFWARFYSKLTMSLVNVLLKFQTLISQIRQYFLLKKCEKLLHCKSISHFCNKKFQCIWL